MYIGKSLMELDALADDLLSKSVKDDEPIDEEKDAQTSGGEDEDLKPEDISDGAPTGDEKPGEDDGGTDEPAEEGSKDDENEDEDEDDDLNKSGSGLPEDGDTDELEKSIHNQFESHESLRQGMEASEFLSSLVDVLTKSITDMQFDLAETGNNTLQSNDILAKSLQASLKMNAQLREENVALRNSVETLEKSFNSKLDDLSKSISGITEKIDGMSTSDKMDKIMEQLEVISNQPSHMRKSVSNINMMDRDFGASLNGAPIQQNSFDALSKAQVMEVLTNELMAKNPMVSAGDIIGYESGAPLRPDLQQLVVSRVK